jgi:uncharacterized membrane protein YhaH (DUF805 family)
MFSGRLNRISFLLGLLYAIVPVLCAIVLYAIVTLIFGVGGAGANIIRTILDLVIYIVGAAGVILILLAQFSLVARRWHDINQSGWLTLLQLVPYLGFLIPLILLFIPGTTGSNKHGDPQNSKGFKAVLFGSKATVPPQVPLPPVPPAVPTSPQQP